MFKTVYKAPFTLNDSECKHNIAKNVDFLLYTLIKYDEEIMTNNDNLESNLLTSSLLKNVWLTCWYKLNGVVYCRR